MGYLPDGTPNTFSLPPVGSSAGGCYASARDLFAFADALASGSILSPELVREITTPKAVTPRGHYGHGFGVKGDPPRIGHNGGGPGADCEFQIIPSLEFAAILLSNVGPAPVMAVVEIALSAADA